MQITVPFDMFNALPVEFKPCVVIYDFDDRGYSPAMIRAWLEHGVITAGQYKELLARLPPQ